MAREPGPAHVFKILLFIVLPFVAAVLIAFFLIYVPDRQTSIIDRNYRVLETAKRQFQGLFRGRIIAFKQFRQKEKKCSKKEQDDEILSLSLQGERELYLHLKENPECTMPIQEIWTPLQKLSVFDNVVLVAPEVKHQIFYQWESPHTIPIVNFKSLLESAPSTPQPQQVGTAEPTPSGARNPLDMQQFMQTGARKYLEVGQFGIAYYLFLIPVSLAQALPQGTQLVPESLQNLTLAGLVRQQHFTNETYKLSPTLLAGIGFVLLMTVLAWPLLRLLYLQSAERLRGLDVRVLIVSGMLAVILFTFFLLYCFTDLVHHKIFDDDMKILGDQLEKNFGEELESMFRPLTVLKDGIKEVCGALRCKENKLPDTAITKKLDDKLREEWDHKLTKKLQAKLETSPDLLHISSLLWISGSGKWVNRWTPEPLKQALTWNLKPSQWVQERRTRPGGPTSQSRRYFTDAQAGLLRAFPRSSDKSNSMYFTLEVVQSQFTGDTTVAMAAPVNEKAYDSHVVAVGSQFPSLTKAILPPGLSFVVIDDTGEVLLHANATKVIDDTGEVLLHANATNELLPENLLQERDKTGPLRSVMFAHRAQHINANYYGTEYRFYITPLAHTPWFLIVFHDKGLLHQTHLALLLGWFLLFSPYMGAWGITFVLLHLFHNRWEWLWPDQRQTRVYWGATCLVILTSIACYATIWKAHALSIVFICWIVMPLLVFALLYLLFAHYSVPESKNSNNEERFKRALRRAYGTMLFALLVAGVIVPSTLVFWDVYQQIMEAVVKQSQLHYANRYEDRAAELLQEQVRESQPEWVVEKRWHAQKHYDSTLAKYMGGASKASSRDKEGQARSIWTFLLCGQGSNRTCEEEFTPLSRHASAAVLQLLSGYDWGGERFGFMIYNETNDLAWRWKLQNRKYDLFWDAPDSSLRRLNGSGNAVQVSANEALPLVSGTVPYDPFDSSQFGPLSLVIGLLVVLVSLGLIYKLLLLAAQRIFLMDYSADDILYGKSESRVPLWLFVNAAGQKLQEPLSSSKVEVIDLLQIPVPSALPYDAWQATDCLIIVDHLASRLHEGVWRVAVLPMLEALAFRYTGPVVILSEIDPLYSLVEWISEGGANNAPPKSTVEGATPPPGTGEAKDSSVTDEFERWARVFAEFCKHRLKLSDASDKLEQKLAKKVGPELAYHLAATVQNYTARGIPEDKTARREDDGLEAHFWTIWSQCTRSEKLALRQLAEEGFLNPGRSEVIRSEVIRSLGHRLLIYRSPALLMRASFRQFVLRAESSQTIAQWEGETEASWFSRLQMPLLAGLIAVMAFLLKTQQELYTTVVALVGTFTAVLPHIIQLFRTPGRRGESP